VTFTRNFLVLICQSQRLNVANTRGDRRGDRCGDDCRNRKGGRRRDDRRKLPRAFAIIGLRSNFRQLHVCSYSYYVILPFGDDFTRFIVYTERPE